MCSVRSVISAHGIGREPSSRHRRSGDGATGARAVGASASAARRACRKGCLRVELLLQRRGRRELRGVARGDLDRLARRRVATLTGRDGRDTLNLPKPDTATSPPRCSSEAIASNTASTALRASPLPRSASWATSGPAPAWSCVDLPGAGVNREIRTHPSDGRGARRRNQRKMRPRRPSASSISRLETVSGGRKRSVSGPVALITRRSSSSARRATSGASASTSQAHISPRPRTARTPGSCSSPAREQLAELAHARPAAPRRRRRRAPPAPPRRRPGPPAKVEPWSPGASTSRSSGEVTSAPIGSPPPSALATRHRVGHAPPCCS